MCMTTRIVVDFACFCFFFLLFSFLVFLNYLTDFRLNLGVLILVHHTAELLSYASLGHLYIFFRSENTSRSVLLCGQKVVLLTPIVPRTSDP
jgi:hypothetical protein